MPIHNKDDEREWKKLKRNNNSIISMLGKLIKAILETKFEQLVDPILHQSVVLEQ